MKKRSWRELISNEISIMKVLNNNPYIIKLREEFEDFESIYYVMELAPKTDLHTYTVTHEGGFLPEAVAASIMRDLFEATDYIHKAAIVHRDLKPENIMVNFENDMELQSLKIIDFGFATYVQEIKKSKLCLGTLNYMAPESFTGVYDHRVDIFALGVILYFILSGNLPFYSDDQDVVKRNTINCELNIESEDAFFSKSNEAKDLISKLIVKDPKDRITLEEALVHPWIIKFSPKK